MSIQTVTRGHTVTLLAPVAGEVRFHPPVAMCGELEVYERGETVAVVAGVAVCAPEHGFVLSTHVLDGERVEPEQPLVGFRCA